MKALIHFLLVALLGATSHLAALAQGPTVFGWQREFYGIRGTSTTSGTFFYPGGYARLSRTRYVVGGYTTQGNGRPNVPFVYFLNQRGDSLSAVRYPTNIYPTGSARVSDIGLRPDGRFVTIGGVSDSLRRYGALMMVCDSLGRLQRRWYVRLNYNAYTLQEKLLVLPDNGCLVLMADVQANGHLLPHLYRFDAAGRQVWERTYPVQDQVISNLVPRLDGSYALIGTKLRRVGSPTGPYAFDVWIGGITAWGDTLPARRYTRLRGNDDPAFALDAALMPDGGLVLAGVTRPLTVPTGTGNPRNSGYLLRLDSAGRVLAQQTITSPVPDRYSPACELQGVSVLADGRVLAAGPYLRLPNDRINSYDAAVLTFDGATLGILSQQMYPNAPAGFSTNRPLRVLPNPDGTLSLFGERRRAQAAPSLNLDSGIGLLRLNGLPAPYQPPYCQTPPVAYFVAALGRRADTLRVLQASTGGPRYGQLVAWHWAWGDGTTNDSPAPGLHAYAAVPAPGTPVRLSVTNNLGCTATTVVYPWGAPSATQASRALAAALQVFPNPAGATAQVRLAGLRPQPPVPAALLDALGRAVWRGSLPVQAGTLTYTLDVSALAAGLYTLRLLPREGPLARRLAVQP